MVDVLAAAQMSSEEPAGVSIGSELRTCSENGCGPSMILTVLGPGFLYWIEGNTIVKVGQALTP